MKMMRVVWTISLAWLLGNNQIYTMEAALEALSKISLDAPASTAAQAAAKPAVVTGATTAPTAASTPISPQKNTETSPVATSPAKPVAPSPVVQNKAPVLAAAPANTTEPHPAVKKSPAPSSPVAHPKAKPIVHPVEHPQAIAHPVTTPAKKSIVKPEPQQHASLEVISETTHSVGLDTINMDSSGNWLEKRIWFQKAENVFGEIRTSITKIQDIRVEYLEHLHDMSKKIDTFYQKVNYDQGEIDQLLKNSKARIEKAREARGDISDSETSIEATIQAEQKTLTQIGESLNHIELLDEQIDKTIGQAFKAIDQCRSFESQAWNNFKAIGDELDDKKAKTLYYEIENAYKNIQQTEQYLKVTLMNYFQTQLLSLMDKEMDSITQKVTALEAKGVSLSKLLDKDEKQDEALEKQRETEAEHSAEEAWEEEHDKKEQDAVKESHTQIHTESSWIERMQCALCHGLIIAQCCWETVYNEVSGLFAKKEISHDASSSDTGIAKEQTQDTKSAIDSMIEWSKPYRDAIESAACYIVGMVACAFDMVTCWICSLLE